MITTIEMEIAIARYFHVAQNIIVPNITWGIDVFHECDLLVVAKSGFAREIEIKVNKYDLIKDNEKKHKHISSLIKKLYFAIPIELNTIDIIKHIPLHAGILTVRKYLYNNKWHYKTFEIRKAKINKNCRALSEGEMNHLKHLGCMRIFGLKEKIVKLRRKLNNKKVSVLI